MYLKLGTTYYIRMFEILRNSIFFWQIKIFLEIWKLNFIFKLASDKFSRLRNYENAIMPSRAITLYLFSGERARRRNEVTRQKMKFIRVNHDLAHDIHSIRVRSNKQKGEIWKVKQTRRNHFFFGCHNNNERNDSTDKFCLCLFVQFWQFLSSFGKQKTHISLEYIFFGCITV